jgi:hypothetical protein
MQPLSYFIESNGAKLHILEADNANCKAMLLLHGYPENCETWKYVLPSLVNDYRMIKDWNGFVKLI